MSHTTIMKFVGNFRQVKFVIQKQFFYFFNFLNDYKLLDSDTLHVRKNIG